MVAYMLSEAADKLGIKVRTIREWMKLGKINAVKNGKYWLITEDEISRVKGERSDDN